MRGCRDKRGRCAIFTLRQKRDISLVRGRQLAYLKAGDSHGGGAGPDIREKD